MPPQWCLIVRKETTPIEYYEGSLPDMLALYDRYALSWTGVVLARVEIPDANHVPNGVAYQCRKVFGAIVP